MSGGKPYGAALTALTPAHDKRQYPDERAADKEKDQTKEGTHGEADVDLRTAGVLGLASGVQIPRGVDQHAEHLRAGPAADQHEQPVGDMAASQRAFYFPKAILKN